MKPTAISYIRFSSGKQAHGSSLERQLDGTRAFCQRQGLSLNESLSITDLGVSAYEGHNADEGNLKTFLDAVRNGTIAQGTTLVIEALDRLTRDSVVEATHLLTDILRHGISIGLTAEDKIYSLDYINKNPFELIVATTYLIRGGEESRIKGERVSDAHARKQARIVANRSVEKIPLPCWLKRVGNTYHIDRKPAQLVRRIFAEYIGGKGLGLLAKEFNREGIPVISKRGLRATQWHGITLRRILRDKATIGFYTHTDPQVPHYYPRLIDDTIFYKAQAALQQRKNAHGRTDPNDINLFKGLTKCEHCGGTMFYWRTKRTKKTHRYYQCYNARHGTCSHSKIVKVENLEDAFLQWTTGSRSAITAFSQGLTAEKSKTEDIIGNMNTLRGQIVEADKAIDNLTKAVEVGGDIPSLVTRLREAQETKTQLRALLTQLETTRYRVETLTQDMEAYIKLVDNRQYEDPRIRLRLRELIRGFVREIRLNPEEHTATFIPPHGRSRVIHFF